MLKYCSDYLEANHVTGANAVMTVIINGVMMMFGCRREKLWIAMEYCGGGSMQDIYHGKLA